VLVPALAADEHSGFISVLRNRGAGRLAPAFHVPVNQAIAVIVADLNGDRRRDIIAADVGRNLVVTAFNDPRRLPATTRHAPRGARISIHTTRAHVAPRERDASFVLRCSRGRGQCRGRLEVRGTGHLRGRLLGRQRFELQPGRHRAVLVGISDDGFSVRRVRVAAFSTYNSARRNAVLTGPTRAERRVACSPKDSRTLATGPRMRVYELKRFPGDATACLPTVGHPVGLGLGYETQGPFAIDGERVAYGAQECGDPAFPCTLDVVVVDVRSGRFLHTAPADGPPANDAGAVSSIVLRSDGVAAWIACFGVVRAQNRCRARGPRSVVTFAGKDRSRRLARGRIRSGSLRLSPSGRRVSWLEGSRRRSAKLEP
jgi:hypothetical protein